MARIKLALPQTFSFSARIPIRITDVNYGGHVGNDTVLSLVHEARMQYLKALGFTEFEFDGVGLIMSDVAIEFKAEVFYGCIIKVFVKAGDIGKAGFDLFYKLVDESSEKVVAVAKTGMVCFDYERKKVVGVPQGAVVKLMAV